MHINNVAFNYNKLLESNKKIEQSGINSVCPNGYITLLMCFCTLPVPRFGKTLKRFGKSAELPQYFSDLSVEGQPLLQSSYDTVSIHLNFLIDFEN